MSKNKKKIDLSQEVMKQIHREKVKMRPRFYFLAGSFLLGIGLVGVVMIATLFVNLAFFKMRIHGPFGYLWFGRIGLRPFLTTFPWLPLLIAVGGISGGLVLLRHYDISYKKSFLSLIIALVVMVLSLGFVLDRLGLNERVEQVEPFRPFYPAHFSSQDWVVGEITQVEEGMITITTPNGEEVKVLRDEKTLLPFGGDFEVGERIRVVGEWRGDTFIARGIGKGGLDWHATPGMGEMREGKMPPRPYR